MNNFNLNGFIKIVLYILSTFILHSQKPELVIQTGHSSEITSIIFTNNGKQYITASRDKTIKIWDSKLDLEIRTLAGHSNWINCLACSPDDRFIVSGGGWQDNTVKLWEFKTGNCIHNFIGHSSEIISVTYSQDGKIIASKSSDGVLKIWDVELKKEIRTIKSIFDGFSSISFSSDSKYIASGDDSNKIIIYDLEKSIISKFLSGHKKRISSVQFSLDGKKILTSSLDNSIIIWNLETGKIINELSGHTAGIKNVCFNQNSNNVTSSSKDNTIKIWSAETGKNILTLINQYIPIVSFSVNPDDKSIIASYLDKSLIKWNLVTGKISHEIKGFNSRISTVALSPDSKYIASNSGNTETIKIWDCEFGTENKNLMGHTNRVSTLKFSSDSKYIISGSDDKSIKIWDIISTNEIMTLNGHSDIITSIALSGEDKYIFSGSADKTIKIWNRSNGKEIKTLTGHRAKITSLSITSDNKYLVSGSDDNTIKVWELESGKIIKDLICSNSGINSVAVSHNNKLIACGSNDNLIKIYNLITGEEIKTLKGHSFNVNKVIFTKDDKYLISASSDNSIKVWDLTSWSEFFTLTGHNYGVTDLTLSSKNKFLISSSWDGTLKIWDFKNKILLASLVPLDEIDWGVVTPNGIFDASKGGMGKMHFVVNNDIIELKQLKSKYYEPLLLSKLFEFNDEQIREVPVLNSIELYPDLQVKILPDKKDELQISLKNQNGGIGRVVISINNKEVTSDARTDTSVSALDSLNLIYSIKDHPFILPNYQNQISVRAFNNDDYLFSQEETVCFIDSDKQDSLNIKIWGIIVGVSDFKGTLLDLKYASKDAKDFADALKVSGELLFGKDNVNIMLLNSDNTDINTKLPTKENIIKTFEGLSKIRPEDILILYFAGHGKNIVGKNDDFYYVTCEASQEDDFNDPLTQKRVMISSKEITDLIGKIPALKQILIVDACASGKWVDKLKSSRNVPSCQRRAFERMQDRMGLHIIAGCAADASSYEATRYGQGLLTYSLLMGMRGAALRENKYIDIKKLFEYAADYVPILSTGVGGIQKPQLVSPYGGQSFDIGLVTETNRTKIPLSKAYPVFLLSNFQDENKYFDHLNLAQKIDDNLREISYNLKKKDEFQHPIVFVETNEFPDAYKLVGRYNITGKKIKISVVITKSDQEYKRFQIKGMVDDLDNLLLNLMNKLWQIFPVNG